MLVYHPKPCLPGYGEKTIMICISDLRECWSFAALWSHLQWRINLCGSSFNFKKVCLCRFKAADIPGMVSKGAPDFCSVYVISKGKISSMRSSSRPAPAISPLRNHLLNQSSLKPTPPESHILPANSLRGLLLCFKLLSKLSLPLVNFKIICE